MFRRFVLLICASLLLASSLIYIPPAIATDTKIYVDPASITIHPAETFSVNICISNVADLFGWQVALYYRNYVVTAVTASEGTFLNSTGTTVFPEPALANDWNATHGRIMFGCSLIGQVPGASGNGVLVTVRFAFTGGGGTVLKIGTLHDDSYLLDPNLDEISFEAEDGYVTSGPVPHDVAIISVVPSATEVFAGQIVELEIVSKNVGTTTETFNVTACYDSSLIQMKTLIDVAPDEETVHQFVWNTSGVPEGIYVVKVLASVVPGEIVLGNNFFLDITVTIKPAFDLSAMVEAPWHLVSGEPCLLKAKATNVGWKPIEREVELQLIVNETVVNNTVVQGLDPAISVEVTFLWTPSEEGTYVVQAYVPQVPGEEVAANNIARKVVAVSPPERPAVQVQPWRSFVRFGEFVRVHICVYEITDLYAWQIRFSFDPEVLEFRNLWLPDDHVFAGRGFVAAPVTVGEGYVTYGVSLLGAESGFNGSGILCKMDLKTKSPRYQSSLQLDSDETFALNSGLEIIPIKIVNSHVSVWGDTIEIVSVETSRTEVYVGWIIEVNVTVINNGYEPHTFDVTAYFASQVHATKKVHDLSPGEEAVLTFCMDTRPLTPYVDYAIWVEATIVVGETWAYNNFFFRFGFWGLSVFLPVGEGLVHAQTIPDINGDAKIDARDIGFAALAFGSDPEHPRWNLLADMNQDDAVNMYDIALVAKSFGKTYY